LRIHSILKDKRITKDKDISDLIELANDGLPNLRARFEVLLNQITALENEKNSLSTEILGLKNSLYTNNEIIKKQNVQLRSLTRKQNILDIMLRNANEDSNHHKIVEIIDQRLKEKKPLLVAAFVAVMETLNKNPYGLNLLNGSSVDIDNYLSTDNDGKSLLQFAELCYNNLLKSYAETIAHYE
jgi:septal ring factor EnvC (AmiA/AmiB activator)